MCIQDTHTRSYSLRVSACKIPTPACSCEPLSYTCPPPTKHPSHEQLMKSFCAQGGNSQPYTDGQHGYAVSALPAKVGPTAKLPRQCTQLWYNIAYSHFVLPVICRIKSCHEPAHGPQRGPHMALDWLLRRAQVAMVRGLTCTTCSVGLYGPCARHTTSLPVELSALSSSRG